MSFSEYSCAHLYLVPFVAVNVRAVLQRVLQAYIAPYTVLFYTGKTEMAYG